MLYNKICKTINANISKDDVTIIMCIVITVTNGQVEMVRKNKTSLLIGYMSPYNPIPPYDVAGFEITAAAVTMALEDYNGSLSHYDIR